jgi:hypothetical protein
MRRRLAPLILAVVAASLIPATADAQKRSTQTVIGCGYRGAVKAIAHPRDCFLGWPNLSLAEAVGLRHITWSTWGSGAASGRAVVRQKTYDPWTPVVVRAGGRRSCGPAGPFVYTSVRVTFSSRGVVHTWKTPTCGGIGGDDRAAG